MSTPVGVMYWCDAETDRVEKANLDGNGRGIVTETPGSHFFGITLDETYLYVTDWAKRWVLAIGIQKSY